MFELYWRPVFEIAVLWFAYYLLLVYVKDSGMAQAMKGLFVLLVIFVFAQIFDLFSIRWILQHLFQISILGFLIIFQPELRRGLTRIGQSPLFKLFLKEEKLVDEVLKSVETLSKTRVGALIAIEREMSLRPYIESGIALDAILTSELLKTVFLPSTPIHDGGAVIQGGRVVAVSCLFPLSQSQKLSKTLGTRHRAGLGLSEETDALVIVVSEETGTVSLMSKGRVNRGVEPEQLRQHLLELYEPRNTSHAKRFVFKHDQREASRKEGMG
ncbi:MAG: TIGR00159 family protein [Omnitrophica bacterium RIFCSPHIGHO2_02_FULL_63_14]|nr:MAG: TIGR00159 family protein [Omnitrophica bacterium RIFCSPHIGHO2_02_FULL_63_14]